MTTFQILTFLDCETTAKDGPDMRSDSVIEVAAAKLDIFTEQVTARFHTLIQPWGPQTMPSHKGDACLYWDLGEYHRKGGHFAGVDFSEGQPVDEGLGALLAFIGEGATIAGQNPPFDLDHIGKDVAACGLRMPKLDYHRIDMCSPAVFLVMAGLIPSVSQRHIRTWAGATGPQAHRAAEDVEDCIAGFLAMKRYYIGAREYPTDRPPPC